MADDYLLRMEGISKSFPGVQALDDVHLNVEAGTVHALMGENGAGKSTLMKVLIGMYQPDEGTITLAGEGGADPRHGHGPAARDLDDPPGALTGARDGGRREHLPRSRARQPVRAHRQAAHDGRHQGAARSARPPHQPALADEAAERRADPDGRDRQGDLVRLPSHHHGRADLRDHRTRGRPPPPDDQVAPRVGRGDHLHHPQARRGLRDLGLRHRLPRRQARHHASRPPSWIGTSWSR